MIYLTIQDKKELVLKLLKGGKTYREIQKIAHVTPNFISSVVKKTFGDKNLIKTLDLKLSKNSKAIQLLSEGKTPLTISLELDMDADQINKAYSDFIRLTNLNQFNYLLSTKNKEKISLLVKLVDFLDKKGIKNIDSIRVIFYDIQYHNILKEEINRFSQINNDLYLENGDLLKQIIENNKILETKKDLLRFYKSKNDELQNEISKRQETNNRLKKLFNNMNSYERFIDLKNILIENIENVILVKDRKIVLCLLAVCEVFKDDPNLRELIHEYSEEFQNSNLSLNNIEERITYLESNDIDNIILKWITKLYESYSTSIFNFVLARYFASKSLLKNSV
jgi:hypothetical protein